MSATTTINVSAIIERQKLNGFLVRLVVISWIITFFDGFDQNVISFAAPTIAPMYHLTRPMMGNVFAIGLVGTMLGGFLFGWIGDRFGRRPAVIVATLLFAIMTLDFALVGSYGGFLAMRLAVGIGTGGMLPLSWALNIEYAPKRWRSSIVTVVMLGYSAGISLGGPIAVWLIPRFGWQSVFLFGGFLSLLAAIALIAQLPESIRFMVAAQKDGKAIADILRHIAPDRVIPHSARFAMSDEDRLAKHFSPRLLFGGALRWITPMLWVAYIFSSMAVFFLATWTPLVFEALSYSRPEAAAAGSITAIAGALGGLALMRFTDTFGAIAVAAMPALAIPLSAARRFRRCRAWRVHGADWVDRLRADRRPFRPAQHCRDLLPERVARQRRRMGDVGGEGRVDRRAVPGRADPRDQPAGQAHLRTDGGVPGDGAAVHAGGRPAAQPDVARGAAGTARLRRCPSLEL